MFLPVFICVLDVSYATECALVCWYLVNANRLQCQMIGSLWSLLCMCLELRSFLESVCSEC